MKRTELAEIIDLDRYPIHAPETAAARALEARCREALATTGAAELPGFLRAEATAALAREAQALSPEAHRHAGKATPYLELPDEHWPEGHPRKSWNPFSLGAVPFDSFPGDSALRALYAWDPLLGFVARCLGESKLYRYADPLGALSLNVMVDADEVEWHFDQADFVVSIALQDSEQGGDFLSVPRIREAGAERYDDVARALAGELEPSCIPMTPGTLLLFNGRNSLHRVTTTKGPTPRLVALLAYDTKPGTCASPMLQTARYGRVLRPETESSAV